MLITVILENIILYLQIPLLVFVLKTVVKMVNIQIHMKLIQIVHKFVLKKRHHALKANINYSKPDNVLQLVVHHKANIRLVKQICVLMIVLNIQQDFTLMIIHVLNHALL